MSHLKGLHHNINYGNLQIIECQQPNNGLRSGLSITFDCHCAVVNCRSVGNKINDIKHEIYNHNLDLCALTETWIKEDENNTIPNCLCPSGYNTISIPCINRTGGGIALIYRSNLDVKLNSSYNFEAMECVDFSLNLDRHNILLAVIYRPPNSSVLQFANELAAYMEKNINTSGEQIMVGDFNVHINKQDEGNAIILSDILESFNLMNHVEFPTHKLQNTLDLVINQQDSKCIRNVRQGHLLSDHHLVLFDVTSKSKVPLAKKQAFRKYKSINLEDFSDDVVKELKSINLTDTTTDDLVSAYDRSLRLVLDTHAPLKVRSIPCRKRVPWFSTDLAEAIRKCRKLERRWSKDPKNREKFLQFYYQQWLVSNMWNQAERSFFQEALADNRTNFKEIFNICNTILGRNNILPLPPSDSNTSLANNFNNYFHEKIGNIYSSLLQQNQAIPEVYGVEVHPPPMPPSFMEFKPISSSDLK